MSTFEHEPEKYRLIFKVGKVEKDESTAVFSLDTICETYADVAGANMSIRAQIDKLKELLAGDEPSPATNKAEAAERVPDGTRGLIKLTCPECGITFVVMRREPAATVLCRCGCQVNTSASALDTFELTCRRCGRHSYGSTNLRRVRPNNRNMLFKCVCGEVNALSWDEAGAFFRG